MKPMVYQKNVSQIAGNVGLGFDDYDSQQRCETEQTAEKKRYKSTDYVGFAPGSNERASPKSCGETLGRSQTRKRLNFSKSIKNPLQKRNQHQFLTVQNSLAQSPRRVDSSFAKVVSLRMNHEAGNPILGVQSYIEKSRSKTPTLRKQSKIEGTYLSKYIFKKPPQDQELRYDPDAAVESPG